MMETYQVGGLHVVHAAPEGAAAQSARPPLLLVHGSGHGAWCWELWQERLPRLGWESYALSLRNHPGSAPVDRETFLQRTTVEDYADDVAAVAAQIGRPAIVVGHSMGGIVVQRFAARHLAGGGALAGLVLLTSVAPGQLGPLRDAPLPTDVPYAVPREVASERYFHSAAPDVLSRALDRICPESPSVTNQYSLGAGVPIAPGEITCPVLVVTAEHDGSVVPRDGRIADYYGGEWLHDAENGHDVMLEAGWAPLLDRILAWSDRHAGRG
ncbi:MAG TPA: alpha/beta hydrolase [bacterium]|nr:alpha/beta hydrolase [bacterium]